MKYTEKEFFKAVDNAIPSFGGAKQFERWFDKPQLAKASAIQYFLKDSELTKKDIEHSNVIRTYIKELESNGFVEFGRKKK